ncbi:hypothetical protein RA20_18270 [Leisingera sp. ANG-Vp]|nr:hypothetical protein RA20_18270 [Leisingera sp. ANG-Vp]
MWFVMAVLDVLWGVQRGMVLFLWDWPAHTSPQSAWRPALAWPLLRTRKTPAPAHLSLQNEETA